MWKTSVSEAEPAGCIRPATADDLPAINAIYAYARRFMAENGNPTQWGMHFPPRHCCSRILLPAICM